MPAPNHAAPQVRPIPMAARMRRPHSFMTTSPRSIACAFRVLVVEGQVLYDTEYFSGRRRSRAPCTEYDETVGVGTQARRARRRLTLLPMYPGCTSSRRTNAEADKSFMRSGHAHRGARARANRMLNTRTPLTP